MSKITKEKELEWGDVKFPDEVREHRLETCGKHGGKTFSLNKNNWIFVSWYCGLFRVCIRCFGLRLLEILDNLSYCQKYGKLYFVDCDNDKQVKQLKHAFSTTAYPQEDNTTIVVILEWNGTTVPREYKGMILSKLEINAQMYTDHSIVDHFASTPEGRRITGFAAGRRDAVKARFEGVAPDTDDMVTIAVPTIISGATEAQQVNTPKRALFPIYGASSPDEVSSLLREMADAHADQLRDMGFFNVRVEYEDQQIKRTSLLSNDVLFDVSKNKEVARQAVIAELFPY